MKNTLTLLVLLAFAFSPRAQTTAPKNPTDCTIAEIENLLEIFKKEKAYDKILSYAQVGVDKATEQYGKEDTTYSKILSFLGDAYRLKKDFVQAEKCLIEAIDIQKIKMPQSPKYAASLNNLGNLYISMGNYTSAERLIEESIKIRKEALGEKHPDYASSLNNLATLHHSMGNYTLAEPLYKKSMKIRKEVLGEKHSDYASSLNNLAVLYRAIGSYALAEPLYKESIKIKKEVLGEKHPDYANSLNNLAVLYNEMGNYALAEPLYKESMKIKKEVLGQKHPDYAKSLNNLALLYRDMGNYASAEALYKEAMQIWKEALGEKHPSYASSLNNLAVLYKNMGNYASAEPLYKEAMKIWKAVLGEKHPDYASSLNNLASLYSSMGSYNLAEPLYIEAMKIKKEAYGERHPDYANSLNNLASLYKDMTNYAVSWDYTQLAITANSGLNISLNINKSWADSLLAIDYSSMEKMTKTLWILYELLALDSIKQIDASSTTPLGSNLGARRITVTDLTLKLLQKSRDNFSDEADKLRTLSETSDWVLRGLKVLSNTSNLLEENAEAEKAFALAEQSKSVLLLDAAQTAMAHSFGDLPDSLVQKEQQLQKQKAKYEAGIVEKRPKSEIDSLHRLLNNLNVEIKDFKTVIEKSFPKYAALKYDNKIAAAKEIQALLDDKTALLEYVIGDSVVYVFYVDKKQVKLNTIYISTKVLSQKTKDFYDVLSNYELAINNAGISYQKYIENAFWFYTNLVDPALKSAKGISNLLIVSDGELGHLPFEAFLTKAAPQKETNYKNLHYLANNYKISYNYSATIWKSSKSATKNTNNGQILSMASNYDIQLNSTKIDWRLPYEQELRMPLKALPAAQKEIQTLSKSFKGFFAFDKDASEKIFKSKASDYAIIHLAMHGLLDNKTPILSSLVFTEDSDSLENNFLHAYEISKMKLNADLVVLSACETGYGRFEKGNGIASLAQAFAYAGVPSLIVSLWQVNDYATSEIMKNLYQHLAEGMEKDEALQQAKLKFIQQAEGIAAHPAFWSPFILMGNTDAIYLETKGGWFWWGIGIGTLVLLGIGFWWMQRKK